MLNIPVSGNPHHCCSPLTQTHLSIEFPSPSVHPPEPSPNLVPPAHPPDPPSGRTLDMTASIPSPYLLLYTSDISCSPSPHVGLNLKRRRKPFARTDADWPAEFLQQCACSPLIFR